MYFLKFTTALLLVTCVFGRPVYKECTKTEIECRKERMKKFFTELSGGSTEFGVKSMDPMILDEVDVPEEALNLIFLYKNLKVTGLKDVVIEDFLKEKDTDITHMTLKYNYIADGLLDVKFNKKDKVITGSINYEAGITGTISYPYSSKSENGKDVSVIGQETLTCETNNVKSTLGEDFRKQLEADPDAQAVEAEYNKIHTEHQAKVACEIAKAAFKAVVQNLRNILKSEH
ncbi:uncharacterized protein LOC128671767 [Plodia interpunctella]|uniref:uncharacterized protein LOC128671767 n=1 Tax=Plodia interpunctella TaxID=58824 RepID=UPI0023686DD3|nr:uncharacterized protein LOC128671767 [Plodia interpunctella]